MPAAHALPPFAVFTLYAGKDYLPSATELPLATVLNTASGAACAAHCANTPPCKYFVRRGDGTCWLKADWGYGPGAYVDEPTLEAGSIPTTAGVYAQPTDRRPRWNHVA